MGVQVFEIDPLQDARWPRFLERHDQATVFHSREWLDALKRTYDYRPVVLATAGRDLDLTSALAFCRVQSWLTGRRAVSMPFSDHCTPLVESTHQLAGLLSYLRHDGIRRKYVEVRCLSAPLAVASGIAVSGSFCLHRLDLCPRLEQIYSRFHVNHVRRKIARAEREQLTYEEGRSELLLQKFYGLAVLTRRRHHVPPQPLIWFRNLMLCMGDRLKIRVVSHQGRPAASTLTLRYKNTMTYKYGVSDVNLHRFGSMQLLLWKTIQEAKAEGLTEFDMGRSDWTNPGLIAFKDHWGAARSSILHMRDPAPSLRHESGWIRRLAQRIFTVAPDGLLTTAGNLLYRHLA